MRKQAQLIFYGLTAALIFAAFVVSPGAWASPSRSAANQTVPTRTPTQEYVPTDLPTAAPPTSQPPTAEPAVTPAPPPPGATVQPRVSPSPATPRPVVPGLTLTIDPPRIASYPGAEITFTLATKNIRPGTAQQIAIELRLPAGLEPGAVLSGGGVWDGRTLRLPPRGLAPDGRIIVVFTVRVTRDATGPAIVLRPTVSVAGERENSATAIIALPPVELPPTGGSGPQVESMPAH